MCCLLSSFLATVFRTFIFSSLPSFFRLRFGRRFLSSCLFLVGSMLSPQFLLRFVQRTVEYDVHLIRTKYVGTLTSLFIFRLWYTILFQLWCVLSFVFLIVFSS